MSLCFNWIRFLLHSCLVRSFVAVDDYMSGCDFNLEHTYNSRCKKRMELALHSLEPFSVTVDERNLDMWTTIFNLCDEYTFEPDNKTMAPILATTGIVTRIMDHASYGARLGGFALDKPGYGFCFAMQRLQDYECSSSPVCGSFEWSASELGLLNGKRCSTESLGDVKGKFVDFIAGASEVRGTVKAFEDHRGLLR